MFWGAAWQETSLIHQDQAIKAQTDSIKVKINYLSNHKTREKKKKNRRKSSGHVYIS